MRTAVVVVEVEYKITSRATEGQIVDAVQIEVDQARKAFGQEERKVLSTKVRTIGEPGGN